MIENIQDKHSVATEDLVDDMIEVMQTKLDSDTVFCKVLKKLAIFLNLAPPSLKIFKRTYIVISS